MSLDRYRSEYDNLFKGLKSEDVQKLDESTLRIIDHVHNRISYTEGRIKATLEIGLALLAFPGPAMILFRDYLREWLVVLTPILACLAFLGVAEICLYIIHVRFRRPFLDVTKTWRWFYHYCIDPKTPVGPWLPWIGDKKKEEAKLGYLEGLVRYAKNTVQSTPQQRLRQDIEQLFVLLSDERLKNEFLKQEQGILLYGLFASVIQVNASLFMWWSIQGCIPQYPVLVAYVVFFACAFVLWPWKVFVSTKSREPWEYIAEPSE